MASDKASDTVRRRRPARPIACEGRLMQMYQICIKPVLVGMWTRESAGRGIASLATRGILVRPHFCVPRSYVIHVYSTVTAIVLRLQIARMKHRGVRAQPVESAGALSTSSTSALSNVTGRSIDKALALFATGRQSSSSLSTARFVSQPAAAHKHGTSVIPTRFFNVYFGFSTHSSEVLRRNL